MKKIPLTRGLFAIVDDDDYERLARFRWRAQRSDYTFYAVRMVGRKTILMHREVLRTKAPQIDHRDRNGLNNRKGNLRSARAWQNAHNRPTYKNKTGFKGVYRDKRGFAAQIRIKGRLYCLGVFNTAEEAALAYNLKAKEGVRGFAWLNPGAAKFITARKPKVYARVTAIGYRGISMVRKLYYVRVKVRGKYVYCKYFRTVSDAVAAYNAEVIKHWGLMDAILNPLLPT